LIEVTASVQLAAVQNAKPCKESQSFFKIYSIIIPATASVYRISTNWERGIINHLVEQTHYYQVRRNIEIILSAQSN